MKKILYVVGDDIETVIPQYYHTEKGRFPARPRKLSRLEPNIVLDAFLKCPNLQYFGSEAKAEEYAVSRKKVSPQNIVAAIPGIFKVQVMPSKDYSEFNVTNILTARVLDYPLIVLNHKPSKQNIDKKNLALFFGINSTDEATKPYWDNLLNNHIHTYAYNACCQSNFQGDFQKELQSHKQMFTFLCANKFHSANTSRLPREVTKQICEYIISDNLPVLKK